jgi:DNA-binding NarL/FixJ family response regulator
MPLPREPKLVRPRVFLADDHTEFLAAAVAFLSSQFEVVGTATNGPSLVSQVQQLQPDVVIVDITMPGMTGIEAVHTLMQRGSTAKFVFLTIHSNEEFVRACLEEGARGYVLKSGMTSHLIPAIRAVLEGRPYISPLASG